ncbi:MAG: prepilin-type N-terminal cleavage/methylation domain-containing protein [Gammaproteobacteria bacterium]|nr:prepilin-type N-terminal cleavage/methylation domain-containing protein [Gammaproteobacteria bacterium]
MHWIMHSTLIMSIYRKIPRGLTLIELMLCIIVAGFLLTIGMNTYNHYIEDAKIKSTTLEMTSIEAAIERYVFDENILPAALSDIYQPLPQDAWGSPFEYLRLRPSSKGSKGKARKDHNLVPINSDYDLYSSGPDGQSVGPLTAKASRDDIVRGNNGSYVGPAAEY